MDVESSSQQSSTAVKREPQNTHKPLSHPTSSAPPLRKPIVPYTFYAISLAKDRKMDHSTLGQAFNAASADLKQLFNAAAVKLGEQGCLGSKSRSKVMNAARSEAVLAAIHSLPFFSIFFERYIKRYEAFIGSMTASVARICEEDYKEWQAMRKAEAREGQNDTDSLPGVSARPEIRAVVTHLPTPPATPRKQTPSRMSATKTTTSEKRRRAGRGNTSVSLSKKKKKAQVCSRKKARV